MNKQQGYALPEVLVATAIIAGVIAATATGLSTVIKGSRTLSERHETLIQAQNISARLQAGLSHSEALAGYPTWRIMIEENAAVTSRANSNEGTPIRLRITSERSPSFDYELILMSPDTNRAN